MFIWITFTGMIGALCRFFLDFWLTERLTNGLPWSTFVINVTGSFLVGAAWAVYQLSSSSETLAYIAMTGFLGAFTTFSTFTIQWFFDAAKRNFAIATTYILLSILAGIIVAIAGYYMVKLILF